MWDNLKDRRKHDWYGTVTAPGGWTGCARRSKTQKGGLQRLAPGGEVRSARRTRGNELSVRGHSAWRWDVNRQAA